LQREARRIRCELASAKRITTMMIGVLAIALASGSFGLESSVARAGELQVTKFSLEGLNQGLTPSIVAGAHPYQLTTTFGFNTAESIHGTVVPVENVRNLQFALPPGIVGNAQAIPKCTQQHMDELGNCPPATQIGVSTLKVQFVGPPEEVLAPVYNLVPPPGMPAQFGVIIIASVAHIDLHVRSASDYGVTATLHGINGAAALYESSLTIWGAPGDASHDSMRFEPRAGTPGVGQNPNVPILYPGPVRPFMRNPTSCLGPLTTSMEAATWQNPDQTVSATPSKSPGMSECENVPFSPSLSVAPETAQAGAPAGYDVNLALPQNENVEGVAEADLRDAKVVLPAGTVLSSSAATGLVGCAAEGPGSIGLHDPEVEVEGVVQEPRGDCPNASKLGSAEVETPLLEKPLKGSVFLAEPKCGGAGQPACTAASATNGELYGLYLEVAGSGVVLKLAGEVSVDPVTGQITTTFKDNPQLPFSELRLKLYGGPQAALANPASCGTYQTTSDLTPWTAPFGADATPSSSFQISQGCGAQGFSPAFTAGTTNNQAGEFSPFSLTFSRGDGEQQFRGLEETLPPGLLAKLAGVPLCSDADAVAGSCPEGSRIGSVTVGVGAGSAPFYTTGKIFLTVGYGGGAYGEVVQVPAVAGPFNLGMVVIRGAIKIDPHTAQATVVSDPFPSILDGIPLQIKTVNVNLDRPAFTFNPSSCSQLALTGSISSTQGAVVPVSSRFQASNCAGLKFKPAFSASTVGKSSRANGASLSVKLTLPAEGPQTSNPAAREANIAKVKVDLPKALPSRLSTLQKACTAAQFAANPAGCPAASLVGHAKAITPILPAPLEGPAYFVSHGGEAFPSLIMVLQGSGVTIDLVGTTFISKAGITSSTFKQVPDAPLSSFELTLPEGKYSALAANLPANAKGSFCGQTLAMPTAFVAQNGAEIHQSTKVTPTGCSKAKKKHKTIDKTKTTKKS
jgi:hypothetical protein